jgi:hypothetical protein
MKVIDEEARKPVSREELTGGGGEGGSGNDAKGLGAGGHQVSWRHWMRGGTSGGVRGSSGDCSGGVLARAAGTAWGCWGGKVGLRSNCGGCCHGDGSVDDGEAQDAVAGSWRAALGSGVIDVEGGGGRAWCTGQRWFRWAYGGGDDVVVCMREEVAQATSPVEGGSRAWVWMASLIPQAILLPSLAR